MEWSVIADASADGRMLELLVRLPRERWVERDRNGNTLLHYACQSDNVDAVVVLLESRLLDVNARGFGSRTAAATAAERALPRVLEMLCAAGADLRARDEHGQTPIEHALRASVECARVLVTNGVRLSTVREDERHLIAPELVAWERGVLCCRAAVVALLRVKRLNEFKQLAVQVWATRCAPQWPASELPPLDWDAIKWQSRLDRLMATLATLPSWRWKEHDPFDGKSFLHFAARGDNVPAVVALLQRGLDINCCDESGWAPVHIATLFHKVRVLEALCAAGADLRALSHDGYAPIDYGLVSLYDWPDDTCVRVLVANGVRLSTVHEDHRHHITPELEAFERGVLRCRAVVVAMLHAKRAGGKLLVLWDRFLLALMARDVWATRQHAQWSAN